MSKNSVERNSMSLIEGGRLGSWVAKLKRLDSKKRLVHLIEFLKDQYGVYEFIIDLLSLNAISQEIYQIICG